MLHTDHSPVQEVQLDRDHIEPKGAAALNNQRTRADVKSLGFKILLSKHMVLFATALIGKFGIE